jgi:hypothetical protein
MFQQFTDGLFEKFLPGWKVRLAAITLFLIGLYPCGTVMEGVDPGLAGGFLCLFGAHVPGVVYTTMYALGLLGGGEKINALVKSNALMAALEKADAPPHVVKAIEEAKPGATVLPGGDAMADATTKGNKL